MYEGVTEYFANLFQINQDLISEEEFYNRIADKVKQSRELDDTMSFTVMSKNVLDQPYKDQYLNVYQKGALIGMCIDLIIREKSNGERGILDLMHKLSKEYGIEKPFNDDELFDKITALTYPEVGEFLKTHVEGTTPIPYDLYLSKVGVTNAGDKVAGPIFLQGQNPYITVDQNTKEISVRQDIALNSFFTELNLQGGDIIVSINNKPYSLTNIYDMISDSDNWKENEAIVVQIKRNGKEQTVKGAVKRPYEEISTFKATDSTKEKLKNSWLKG
jgi:predicted metalloprotease with PDZ domain